MFFSAEYFFLRYLLTRYFFPRNQSAGYFLLKSPMGKGIVLLGYQTKFVLGSVSSFATHFAHLPPLKVMLKPHEQSRYLLQT